jgi:hypothetical protein
MHQGREGLVEPEQVGAGHGLCEGGKREDQGSMEGGGRSPQCSAGVFALHAPSLAAAPAPTTDTRCACVLNCARLCSQCMHPLPPGGG